MKRDFHSTRPDPPPVGSGPAGPPSFAATLARCIKALDQLFERTMGSRWNPLLQSGNLAILFLLVALVTGLYLFLFYSINDPHGSVERIREHVFLGSWARSLHRYAADLTVLATIVHMWRKVAQGQTWGPRALAWTSGLLLLAVLGFCGWTGLILVWDAQGLSLALEGARIADLLPLFSTPLSRTFRGAAPLSSSFFFMNLFLHLALPLGLAALLGIHVARLARPALLPLRRIAWTALAATALLAAVAPTPLAPAADLMALPDRGPLDLFFAFWLPAARRLGPVAHVALWIAVGGLLLFAPRWWRPRKRPINTSWVDENSCTGCTTCSEDCPYEAIQMVPRTNFGRQQSELVARVDPSRCVGCGICAGSCAPMGVGPFGRTGRDQLASLDRVLGGMRLDRREILLFGCSTTGWDRPAAFDEADLTVVPVSCAGSLHSSAIESALRRGVGGVLVLSCPTRDCRYREGPKWLGERLYAGREAELHERVDRRRVAYAALSLAEIGSARRELAALRKRVAGLDAVVESAPETEMLCRTDELAEEIHV